MAAPRSDDRKFGVKTTVLRVSRVLVWLLYAWVAIVLVLLLLTFILLLFGANPEAGFVDWVYRSVERAMAPFRGIFEQVPLSDQSVLDVSVLFAMIVYLFVALGLNVAIDWLTRQLRASERHDQQAAPRPAAATAPPAHASAPARVVQLSGQAGASASATLAVQPWGTSIELAASGLDVAHTYGVWLESSGGGRVTAGTFQPMNTGSISVSFSTSASLAHSQRIGVTRHPGAGEFEATDVLTGRLA
jgi:hypothetical protein